MKALKKFKTLCKDIIIQSWKFVNLKMKFKKFSQQTERYQCLKVTWEGFWRILFIDAPAPLSNQDSLN